ncbi:MAG: hypothetical protein LBN21_07775, partial [Treponema sp.]|nr:hypothetical protein [Treponema sp.]
NTGISSIGWVNGAAFGKGKFVIGSTGGVIAYSNDGNTWVDVTPKDSEDNNLFGAGGGSGAQGAVNSVVFSADKGLFVAVGGNSGMAPIAATSSDGITWTQTDDIKIAETNNYIYVGYGAGVFLIGYEGASWSYSTDAYKWTTIDDAKLEKTTGIAYGAGKFVMVGGDEIAYSIPE